MFPLDSQKRFCYTAKASLEKHAPMDSENGNLWISDFLEKRLDKPFSIVYDMKSRE